MYYWVFGVQTSSVEVIRVMFPTNPDKGHLEKN